MDPTTVKLLATVYSMRREIKILLLTIVGISLVPILTVILLTQAGLDFVSGALATRNPQIAQVDIHDPTTGAVIDRVTEPVIWPVSGPVSLEFGQLSPYQLFHTGIDIAGVAGEKGAPISAFMKGRVIYAGSDSFGFGTHVIIDHGHYVTSLYGHLETLRVICGQEVEIGAIIGTLGNTGWSTGPHLHFQINVFNIPVNPRTFLIDNP